MNKLKDNLKPISLLLVIPVMYALYFLVNSLDLSTHDVTTAIDRSIPFLKIFVIPYVIWYLFVPIILIALCFYDRKMYYKTILVYILGFSISLIIFSVYQTTVPRPDLAGSDILTKITMIIYANDKPINCLPSLHVFASYLMFKAVCRSCFSNFKINAATSFIAFMIIISTLFTKQHGILDAIAGIILVDLLFLTIEKPDWRKVWLMLKKLYYSVFTKLIYPLKNKHRIS